MKGILVTSIALAGLLQMSPVSVEAAEQPAPASVALFYDALTTGRISGLLSSIAELYPLPGY
jgi:hypothetical protein